VRVCSTRALAGERVHGRSLSRPFIVRIRCRRDPFFQRARQRHFQIPRSERLPPTSPFFPTSEARRASGPPPVPSPREERARLPTRFHPVRGQVTRALPVFGAERGRPRAARRFLPYVTELEARPPSPRQLEPRGASPAKRDDRSPCDDDQLIVPAQEVKKSKSSSHRPSRASDARHEDWIPTWFRSDTPCRPSPPPTPGIDAFGDRSDPAREREDGPPNGEPMRESEAPADPRARTRTGRPHTLAKGLYGAESGMPSTTRARAARCSLGPTALAAALRSATPFRPSSGSLDGRSRCLGSAAACAGEAAAAPSGVSTLREPRDLDVPRNFQARMSSKATLFANKKMRSAMLFFAPRVLHSFSTSYRNHGDLLVGRGGRQLWR
jgi:hypothetical protein